MDAALADSERDVAGARGFIGWIREVRGLKELRTPGAKQQAVRKMDGLLTVPPMEPGLFRLSFRLGPLCGERKRALISGILNYVFTCVVAE